jgi:hypothetical protein
MSICSLVDGDGPLLCGKSSRPAPPPTADPRAAAQLQPRQSLIDLYGPLGSEGGRYGRHRRRGFTHDYLEPLEALADRRRVIFHDQLDCRRDPQPALPRVDADACVIRKRPSATISAEPPTLTEWILSPTPSIAANRTDGRPISAP